MESKKKTIFLVDDSMTNLAVGKNALIGKYNVITMPSSEKMFKMLKIILPDLILLDVDMPGMNGYEATKILKSKEKTKHIPVIFLTVRSDKVSELEGLSLGAIDYVAKPFSPPLLLKRIELHLLVEQQKRELKHYNDNLQEMVREQTQTVIDLENAILKIMAELVEYRDDITGGHIERTQRYLGVLIDSLSAASSYGRETASWDYDFVVRSAQLHDVGKIAIKDSILKKPAKLTYEEFEEMKTHTTFGRDIIKKAQESTTEKTFLEHAKIFAGTHHEKWDGSGYPLGLAGEEIPLQGRLMAIADVYDALISDRPYKKAFTHEEAVKIIGDGKGTHFDPYLVDVFMKREKDFKDIVMSINKKSEEEKP